MHLDLTTTNINAIRKKWDSLKASYIRSKKKLPTGSGGKTKNYKFAQLMSFLDDTGEPRKTNQLGGAGSSDRGGGPSGRGSSELGSDGDGEGNSGEPSNKRKNHFFVSESFRSEQCLPLLIKFIFLGKNKSMEKLDLKRRYVECLEKSQQKPLPEKPIAIALDDEDAELEGFGVIIKKHLKSLPTIARLLVQQSILQLLVEALQKQQT